MPSGKSLIFPARAGSVTYALVTHLMTNPEDVQRMAVGRFSPFGHRLHVRRYDAGDLYPDMELVDAFCPTDPDSGVWRLPLQHKDLREEQGMRTLRRSAGSPLPGPIVNEKLGGLLDRLPPGKYVVGSCRGFPHGGNRGTIARGAILRMDDERAGRRAGGSVPGKRSAPGSLSATAVTDSRSGLSSRGWADSLLQSCIQHGELYHARHPLFTGPKHRHRPRRRAPSPMREPRARRKAPLPKNRPREHSDRESDAERGRRTLGSRLRRLATTVTGPREAVRSFRKALREPLRDPLKRAHGLSGSSSAGST